MKACGFGSDVVVAATEVLHEGMAGSQDPGGAVLHVGQLPARRLRGYLLVAIAETHGETLAA